MESKCACVGGCKSGGQWGWPVIIVLAMLGATYFGGGIYYNRKYRGFSGTEAVPHVAFWMDLPFLCKDGMDLAWSWSVAAFHWLWGRIRGTEYSTY
uniref:Uncharacterized protein n=1 Tax=Eutreptiella gymnastica TaxID=73025 RepID=A0A7S4CG15_9EUGL